MFYYLYEIRNNLNGKIYVGVHKTKNMNDGYMGSGKVIKTAIEKHGIENFSKTILETFSSEEEMYAREKEVVDDIFLMREDVYNLRRGGTGGFEFINKNGLNKNDYERSDEWKANLSKRMKENNPSKNQKVKEKNSARLKKDIAEGKHPFGDSDKQRELCTRQIEKGTHPFMGEKGRKLQEKRIKDGTHNFCEMNISQYECNYCGIKTTLGNYKRWHGNNCKQKGHREWNEDLFSE